MAQVTFDISPENVTRFLAALAFIGFEQEEGESDLDWAKRWVRGQASQLVHGAEKSIAMSGVPQDPDILT